MSNSETESASTTLENSVEVNIKPVNSPKNNNNYSNSMKATFGNNSNAFENNTKNEKKNEKNTNTTPINNKKTDSDLDSKMNEIQPMLEKLKELKTSYESATNADKGTIEKEFETTKQKVIDLQEEINSIVAGMNVKSNSFTFFEENYPTYMKTLKELEVVKNNSTEKVEEDNMGSVMSNSNSNSMSVNSNQGSNANSNASTITNANSQSIANNNKNNNNTKKNNTNVAKNNTKKNNTKPTNTTTVPVNNATKKNNLVGGKRRKNKSRKANKRR